MKVVKEICESPWDFILYETEEGFVMNVEYSKSFVDYSRSFRISEKEAHQDIEALKKLAEQIRNNDKPYLDKEVKPVVRKS